MSTASVPPAGPVPVAEKEPRGTLGLGSATALIVGAPGRPAVIRSLEQLSSLLAGNGGTRIPVQAEGMETR